MVLRLVKVDMKGERRRGSLGRTVARPRGKMEAGGSLPPGERCLYTFCSQCVEMFSPRVLLSLIVKARPPRICD